MISGVQSRSSPFTYLQTVRRSFFRSEATGLQRAGSAMTLASGVVPPAGSTLPVADRDGDVARESPDPCDFSAAFEFCSIVLEVWGHMVVHADRQNVAALRARTTGHWHWQRWCRLRRKLERSSDCLP